MKLKHYLIASQENGYAPWITSATALALFCAIALGIRLLILPSAFTQAGPGIDAVDLMARINQERTNRYLPALSTDQRLVQAATGKSNDMLARSYFAHVDPDGKYVWPRIEAAGYKPYLSLGENLAMDFTTSAGVVTGWMNSPGHRANLLNEKFQDQGLAAIYGLFEPNHYTTAVTSLFGVLSKKPAASPPVASSSAPKPAASGTAKPAVTSSPAPAQETTGPADNPAETPATDTEPDTTKDLPVTAPVTQAPAETSETQLYYALRVIFTIFAAAYVFFLITDSVIIYKAKIKRGNAPASPHTLLMLLFVLINVFTLYL